MRRIITEVRNRRLAASPDTALGAIASYREGDGQLLTVASAAVELINVLRPTVAVARCITFAALALHEHPDARRYLMDRGEGAPKHLANEVRRFYPFFPAIGSRVRTEFEWRGQRFTRGTWILLDLYGSNRDPRTWEALDAFRRTPMQGRLERRIRTNTDEWDA